MPDVAIESEPQDLPLFLDPALAEEAVLLAIRGHAELASFRRDRDAVYLEPERERGARFNDLHGRWFERLNLGVPVATALAELPILAKACARVLVVPAASRRDEGADLLVAPEYGGTGAHTVLIRLRPTRFADGERLLAQLRAELLHVADMLDPAFGYEPHLPALDNGPAYEQLVRDRYRVLWQVTVVGRLSTRGVCSDDERRRCRQEFEAAFPMLGDATSAAFERFFTTWPVGHSALVAFAADPRALAPSCPLGPGGRCPLCRFSTYSPEPEPGGLSPEIVARIVSDFPGWHPAQGLCRQCADLYRARGSSAER